MRQLEALWELRETVLYDIRDFGFEWRRCSGRSANRVAVTRPLCHFPRSEGKGPSVGTKFSDNHVCKKRYGHSLNGDDQNCRKLEQAVSPVLDLADVRFWIERQQVANLEPSVL